MLRLRGLVRNKDEPHHVNINGKKKTDDIQ